MHLDPALVDQHIHVLVSAQTDLKRRAGRANYCIPGVYEEGSRAVPRNAEMSLTLAKKDLAGIVAEARLDDGVGIECDDRPVGQGDIAMLPYGGGQRLSLIALVEQPRGSTDRCNNGRRGGEPPLPATVPGSCRRRRVRCVGKRRHLQRPMRIGKSVQGFPDFSQFLVSTPVARILPQPGLETLDVGRGRRTRVRAPDPCGGLLIDFRPRAQFDDFAHSLLPLSATLRRDRERALLSTTSNKPSSLRYSRQRTSPLATCFSIVLSDTPRTSEISACESLCTLRRTNTRLHMGGRRSTATQNDSKRRRASVCSSGGASSEKTVRASKSPTVSVA